MILTLSDHIDIMALQNGIMTQGETRQAIKRLQASGMPLQDILDKLQKKGEGVKA